MIYESANDGCGGWLYAVFCQATASRSRGSAAARRSCSDRARAASEKAATRLRDHLLRRGFPGGVVAQVVRESLRLPQDDA